MYDSQRNELLRLDRPIPKPPLSIAGVVSVFGSELWFRKAWRLDELNRYEGAEVKSSKCLHENKTPVGNGFRCPECRTVGSAMLFSPGYVLEGDIGIGRDGRLNRSGNQR